MRPGDQKVWPKPVILNGHLRHQPYLDVFWNHLTKTQKNTQKYPAAPLWERQLCNLPNLVLRHVLCKGLRCLQAADHGVRSKGKGHYNTQDQAGLT